MNASVAFLSPVDQMPAEGSEFDFANRHEVDLYASLFADSALTFDVARTGVTVQQNPHETELFQRLHLRVDGEDGPAFDWQDDALEIQLQQLFSDDSAFQTLSDASEPVDYVRRFLEVLQSSVDTPEVRENGRAVPLVRWQAGEDGESAQVQLLGLLLADDDTFERFCQQEDEGIGLIFEDSEVEARGFREVVTALTLLGVTLGSVTPAEAGIFKNLKQKRQQDRLQQVQQQQNIQRAKAPIQQSQSGWVDVHRDAYVNHALLEQGQNGQKKIVVDVSRQRAYLLIDNMVAIDTAVSTARSGKITPRGTFKITERVQTGKISTIYGSSMPYWQRLDQSAIGLHVGDLPGYPASAGCIRLPESVAPILFAHTARGIEVQVVDAWRGPVQSNSGVLVAQVVDGQQGS